MDAGFPYGDIIVIAAVAAFIILRYRAMLGEPRGRDEPGAPPSVIKPQAEFERVIQLAPTARPAPEKKPQDNFASYGALAETFVAMRAIDREFNPEEFLNGARTAYEMVLTAFSKRDRDTLKMLLSPELYKSFDRALVQEEADKRYTDTTLVAIERAVIDQAVLDGSKATLTVDFTSEQIHLVRDENRAIIEGNASAQSKVEDRWVFTRDLKSTSPNWVIIET